MATPTMAHDFRSFDRAWSFKEAMAEVSPRCPSETSEVDFAEHDDYQLASTVEEIKQTIVEHGTPATFDDRYMSSEEQLSPTENDSDYGDMDYDDNSVLEVGIAAPLQFTVCDMAVAICVVAAGRPQMVDVTQPMKKSSPVTGRGIGFGRATWMPHRRNVLSRSKWTARNADRPQLPTLYSVPYAETEAELAPRTSTTASTAPSTASDNSPILSASSNTPPTSAYTESDGHGSPGSLFYNTFSHNGHSPKKEFSIDRSNTVHSFLETDPYENSAPPVRKHSRFRNLSQKIKISRPRFGKSQSNASDEAVDKDSFESTTRPEPIYFAPPALEVYQPKRRMVARGAAEREPTIEIPDCPYDLDDAGEFVMAPRRLRRRPSFGY